MAEVETALYSIMSGDATLSALVSTRIYPEGEVPQDCAQPYVTFRRISGMREHAMSADPGLVEARFEVSAWDDDYAGKVAVATAIRGALQDFSGTQDTVAIERIFCEGDHDVYDIDTLANGRAWDFIVWHLE